MNRDQFMHVTVVIDAFRAFATACYVLERKPKQYIYAPKSSTLKRLAADCSEYFFIGKNEIGADIKYDIPNSPTRVTESNITGRCILHRSEAGAKGLLNAADADVVLAASFVNAEATVRYLRKLKQPDITIVPMGFEGNIPSIEDDICAAYITGLINGQAIDIKPYMRDFREGPGACFFGTDQWQYPQADFNRCTQINCFDFAIRAKLYGDYAVLMRC